MGEPFDDHSDDPVPVTGNGIHQPPVLWEIELPEIIDAIGYPVRFWDQAFWYVDTTEGVFCNRIERGFEVIVDVLITGC